MSLNSFRNGLGHITSSPIGKWSIFVVGALLVFSLAFSWNMGGPLAGANGGAGGAAAQTGDDVIATVNGDPITRSDFEQEQDSFRRQFEQFGRTVSVSEAPLLNNTVLDQLINAKLQVQQAKNMHVTVTNDEIQKKRAEIIDQSGLREKLSLPATASVDDINAALAKAGSPPLSETLPDDTVRADDPARRSAKRPARQSSGHVQQRHRGL